MPIWSFLEMVGDDLPVVGLHAKTLPTGKMMGHPRSKFLGNDYGNRAVKESNKNTHAFG